MPPQVHWSTSREHGIRLAQTAVEQGADRVIVAGGDGTVEAIAHVLVGTSTALGILPLGTMNNLAHSVGIPDDLKTALDILTAGKRRRISVGVVQGRIFLEAVSVGIEAQLSPVGEAHRHRGIGGLVRLAWAGIQVLAQSQAHRITLILDGHCRRVRAWQVTVVNAPHYGLGFTPTLVTRMDDLRFEVVVARPVSKWGLLRHYWSIMQRRRTLETRVQTFRARHIRIAGAVPLPVAADGQIIGQTPVAIRLWPDALEVIAPPATAGVPSQPRLLPRIRRALALSKHPIRGGGKWVAILSLVLAGWIWFRAQHHRSHRNK
jgi:diacylglycerol kinase family enzyme